MNEVKIKKVDVHNLKAVSNFTAFFDGKSAHVTGANGYGKSTVIRALTDRLRGLKPEIITKIGETEGKTTIELTDGCKFVWEYNNQGADKLSYFAPNEFKPARRDIFKSMCSQYFPNQFDINKFLTTTEPRKRLDMISQLINIDLSDVQERYKHVAEIRKDAKKALKLLEDQIMPKPEAKSFENIDEFCKNENESITYIQKSISSQKQLISAERSSLNAKYLENKAVNDAATKKHQEQYQKNLEEWLVSEEKREVEVLDFNNIQKDLEDKIEFNKQLLYNILHEIECTFLNDFFNTDGANKYIENMPQPEVLKTFIPTAKPELTKLYLADPMPSDEHLNNAELKLVELENQLSTATEALKFKEAELGEIKAAKQLYDIQVKQYTGHQADIKERYDYVQECEANVLDVLNEIKSIVKSAKLPDEFSIDLTNKNDILFKVSPDSEYLAITNETLASSAIFIAAFKLQANYLTAFKVAHFDVSYLDFENRKKVLDEAIKMGIQLITESPAMTSEEMQLQYVLTED